MSELKEILDAIDGLKAGEPAVLATLIAVNGSSYRRVGARMLILSDGRRIGGISGGCLENDVCERANCGTGFQPVVPEQHGQDAHATGEHGQVAHATVEHGQDARATVLTYSTGEGDEAILGFGMGCKGELNIMLERVVGGSPPRYLAFLREAITADAPRVLATVFATDGSSPRVGDRLMFGGESVASDGRWDEPIVSRIAEAARGVLAAGRSRSIELDGLPGRLKIALELLRPCTRLVIFGAVSASAATVAALGKQLGWHVTICDRRPDYLRREHFPQADELLLVTAAEAQQKVKLDQRTVAVVMTHNYPEDLALLAMLLPSAAAYIGLLGSRPRRDQLLADLRREGSLTEEQLRRLYGPVGLDIGADSPGEIALAIIAEIQMVLRGRAGASLRDRPQAIHDEARQ
jgi:xanthine/CO dehydrogenase XdhC/CoxF family maturation factor